MRIININVSRKMLYVVLSIILVSVLSLTIVYAALSVTLNITGNAQVVASSWDIHLANPKVKSGSVSTTAPTISGNDLSFSTSLTTPGDYYEFTVDVVNDGTIDAMIDSVVKTPELTAEQAKYFKYEVSYQNGESINANQTIRKGTSTPIKVRIEYRKDLVASDLPTTTTNLSLKLSLIYVQSDGSGSEITNNGYGPVKIVSGDSDTIGSETCIGEECFYVISSDANSVTMLAKYNLYVGDTCTFYQCTPLENPTGMQDEKAIGYYEYDAYPVIATTKFSNSGSNYNGSIVEEYVNNYKIEIEKLGIVVEEARIITYEELTNSNTFNCMIDYGCSNKYTWIYTSSYWVGSADSNTIYGLLEDNVFVPVNYSDLKRFGVRPVITIAKQYF